MVASSDAEPAHAPAAGACQDPAHSASAFPKSFPVIQRSLSTASSCSDAPGEPSPNGLGHGHSAASSVDGDSPKLANGGGLHFGREATPSSGPGKEPKAKEACNGASHAELPAAAVPNGTSHTADSRAPEPQQSAGSEEAAPARSNGTAEQEQAVVDQQQQQQPAITSKASGSSLKAESEPFIPSGDSSRQATPRSSNGARSLSLGGSGSGGGLNVNAAAFVPSGLPAASVTATPPPPPPMEPLRFGDLPESLTATPNLLGAEAEWPGHADGSAAAAEEQYPEQEQWGEDWGEYGAYDPAAYAAYAGADGMQYYQQPDGTWVYWDAETGQWQAYWQGEQGAGYGSQDGGRQRKPGRGAKRGGAAGERRRPESRGWQSAAAEVLDGQFGFGREACQEMLELHGGDLATALDMLAQLEAENEGALSANGQEAPELNDQNFPSLSEAAAEPQPPAPAPTAKGGFAAAVRSSAPPQPEPAPAPAKPAANGHASAAAAPHSPSEPVPWVETGGAVSSLYADARAEARDHARARNAFFQEATKAFLAGDKALAKELGAKGRQQSELMKAAHVRASQAIYKHRNPTAGRRPGSGGLLDLHGLHVSEALAVLEREVGEAQKARARGSRASPRRLSVLVGTGRHTQGSRTPARLPAAVEDWLRASQVPFTSRVDGLLEIMP